MATINLGRIKPVFKGAYASGTAYVVDDIVVYSDESYICIQAGTGQTPSSATAYWTKIAAKGTNGDTFNLANKEIAFKTNAGALDGIPIGTSGQALKVNSGATGYEFGAVAGGKLLQVVSASDATVYSSAPGGSTFIEPLTSLRAVITPSATSSKIYVMLTLPMAGGDGGNVASGQLSFDTAGGSSNVIVPPNSGHQVDGEYAHFPLPLLETVYDQHSVAYSVLHSPNTTSALTYKFRAKSESTSGDLYINRTQRDSTSFDPRTVATITAMEIGV